jgi:hypothetical protein
MRPFVEATEFCSEKQKLLPVESWINSAVFAGKSKIAQYCTISLEPTMIGVPCDQTIRIE